MFRVLPPRPYEALPALLDPHAGVDEAEVLRGRHDVRGQAQSSDREEDRHAAANPRLWNEQASVTCFTGMFCHHASEATVIFRTHLSW